MFVKIVLTLPPARPTAPKAMSAMRATSNAYSSRSCPDSSRTNERSLLMKFMTFSLRVLQTRGSVVSECGHASVADRAAPDEIATAVPGWRAGAPHTCKLLWVLMFNGAHAREAMPRDQRGTGRSKPHFRNCWGEISTRRKRTDDDGGNGNG